MAMKELVKDIQKMQVERLKVEMADAHCHLDLITDHSLIAEAVRHGVSTIITNGVNLHSNKKALALADGKHIFPALGVDPEYAVKMSEENLDDEVDQTIALIRANKERVVGIGEIGLDYTKAQDFEAKARQRTVFERFLDLAKELKLPVSVHSRDAMDVVLGILKEREMQKVHMHFFEGNVQQAKEAERMGYMISIPPIDSTKRRHVIKDTSIDHLLAESDSPAVGASPIDTEYAVRLIAEVKGLTFERTAEALTLNTKRFFGVHTKLGFMRS